MRTTLLLCVLTLCRADFFPRTLKRQGCLPPDGQANLFCPGDEEYACYKIPTLLRTANGTLLAMIEARKFACDDQGYVDLRVKRSFDDGATWGASELVYSDSTDETHWTTVGDANLVQDKSTGAIWLLHTRNNSLVFLSSSDDEGLSWSEPCDMTAALKLGFPSEGWVGMGHAGGIQLSAGPAAGRLLIPAYTNTPYAIYSDDHGSTWQMGGGAPGDDGWNGGGENQIAETGAFADDGTPVLVMNFRDSPTLPNNASGNGFRLLTFSYDGGLTWSAVRQAAELPEPIKGCEGSTVYHPGTKKLYFSHPDPYVGLFRERMRIWSSADGGATWEVHATVWRRAAGYSALAVMGSEADAELGLLYDRNNHTMIVFEAQSVSFATVAP